MDKHIFKKFTIENKILLTPESLSYMVEHIQNKTDVEEILTKYRQHGETSTINFEKIKLIIDSHYVKQEVKIDVVPWKYENLTRIDRYNFLKSLIKEEIKLIDDIEEYEKAIVFGVIYNDKQNKLLMEDESGCIELEFNTVDCFITDFMFLILQGTKTKTTFLVDKIINTPLKTKKIIIEDESMIFTKSLLFYYGKFEENVDTSKYEIFLMHPEDKKTHDLAVQKGLKIIEKDEYSSNNPVYIHINDKSIVLFCTEFFKNKEKGYFLGNKYVKSLIRMYISQYDLSPFSIPHMYIDVIPDVFVIFQDSYTFIEKCDAIGFISVAPFKTSRMYLEYNPTIDMFVFKKSEL